MRLTNPRHRRQTPVFRDHSALRGYHDLVAFSGIAARIAGPVVHPDTPDLLPALQTPARQRLIYLSPETTGVRVTLRRKREAR